MKTRPIQLPIDPKKTYVAINGLKTTSIVDYTKIRPDQKDPYNVFYEDGNSRWLYPDGTWKRNLLECHKYDLISEVIPDEQPKKRDWSGVIQKLFELTGTAIAFSISEQDYRRKALAILQEFDRKNMDGFMEKKAEAEEFRDKLISQEFDRQWIQTTHVCIAEEKDSNKPVCAENAPTETIKENLTVDDFVVGELYEDRNAEVYHFIGKSKYFLHGAEDRKIFVELASGILTVRGRDGNYIDYPPQKSHLDIIRKHTSAQKEHIYSRQEIEEELVATGDQDSRGKIIRQLMKELGEQV